MPDACFKHAAFRPSMSVGACDGESSSSEEDESKAPMSSFDGRVFERVGLGRDDDAGVFEEGFSVLSALGDLGDLERLEGVDGVVFDGRTCADAARDGRGFEGVGFAGASFGEGAFGGGAAFGGAAFGAATFGGGAVFAGVGFGGSGLENFDGVGFGGSGFEDEGEDFDDFFAGVVGAVVVGVGVWPFASCASCCARSFTLRNISIRKVMKRK